MKHGKHEREGNDERFNSYCRTIPLFKRILADLKRAQIGEDDLLDAVVCDLTAGNA